MLLLMGKLIPRETKEKLKPNDSTMYRNNLIKTSICFVLTGILFFVQNYFSITNLLIYVPIIIISWYAVRQLIKNINILNEK
ncbi:hypothetical protein HZY83_03415 [Gemella sp. GH3]|uniref:hypothetical protein n=1 Tax=unclassified Gemella TaxID=2624949 RepID=UPI0015D0642C|nr:MULTISPECIES: hypothetical protein [unclassified Gemella]MBF0713730.1 hypothetical protein [Gemella sp. GH3.1]NYS50682.1 hypothetical protein [Gemella sp. GH3]